MSQRIGNLRHRFELQQPSPSPDGAGGIDVTWTPVATLWAALKPISAVEIDNADGRECRVTHEIVLRHRPGVSTAMRFIAGARVFDIRGVNDPTETGFWLRCLVEERTP